MNGEAKPTVEQNLEIVFKALNLLGNAFLQLTARVDTVKAAFVELHPELADQLEERIRKAQTESVEGFAALQKLLEFLHRPVSTKVQ